MIGYLTMTLIASFLLRLLERQRGFRYETGKRAFDGLMDSIRQQVASLS